MALHGRFRIPSTSHSEDIRAANLHPESHPSLYKLAEPHLYSQNFLTTGDSPVRYSNPADLLELLSKRPHIVHHIRSLQIYINGTQRHHLQGISIILPKLLALREITLNHTPCLSWGLSWEAHPENFRLAFLRCLRLQSIRDVRIIKVPLFPFSSALNGECKSIKSLMVRGSDSWRHSNPSQINNLDLNGPYKNQTLPLESLRLEGCGADFIEGFVPWFATCRSQLQSLEFSSYDNQSYDSLPMLLMSSTNSLTSLDIDLGFTRTCFYNFNISPIVQGATKDIPVALSTLPHLKQLTICAILCYVANSGTSVWGFYSPIPAITQLFSSESASNTPSLKHLILDFDHAIESQGSVVQTKSLPLSSLSEVTCTPLIHLLSTISAFECSRSSFSTASIQVTVDLHPSQIFPIVLPVYVYSPRTIPLSISHSFLSGSKALMQFVDSEQGRLIVIPSISTSFKNASDSDCW